MGKPPTSYPKQRTRQPQIAPNKYARAPIDPNTYLAKMTNHHHLHLYHQPKETGHPGPWLPQKQTILPKTVQNPMTTSKSKTKTGIYSKMRNGVAAQPTM